MCEQLFESDLIESVDIVHTRHYRYAFMVSKKIS